VVYVLALGAAALFGAGSAVQQRVAATAPPGSELHFSLLLYLFRQPLWLVGVVTAIFGNLLSGTALGIGGIGRVEPLLVTRLLFALPISAAWSRRWLHPRDWLAAVAVVAGMAAFLASGDPEPGDVVSPPVWRWLLTFGAIGGLTVAAVALARRLRPESEAPVLGIGAGMLFGLQGGLTQTSVRRFIDDGLRAMLVAWPTYAVVAVAVLATLLAQSAFKLEPLPSSYPPMAVAEPLAGIAIGVGVLGGSLRLSPLVFAIQVISLMVMAIGVYLLASSPLVIGEHPKHPRGRLHHALGAGRAPGARDSRRPDRPRRPGRPGRPGRPDRPGPPP